MAAVTLQIGGNSFTVQARDGDEAPMLALGRMLDERWGPAQRASGDAGLLRVMLLVALMLADELNDARASASGDVPALADIAERLENLATALERTPANA